MPRNKVLKSDIIAVSLDASSSPSININFKSNRKDGYTPSWGLGWYPEDNLSTMLTKGEAAKDTAIFANAVTDWSNFRSTTFFYKIKSSNQEYSYNESQPFSRNLSGRDWMFLHSGILYKQSLKKLQDKHLNFLLEPIGNSDSELAFCHILSKIYQKNLRSISEIDPDLLYSWFKEIDLLGSADIYLTDGDSIVCFHGTSSQSNMLYSRIQPPYNQDVYTSESIELSLDDPRDTYRTALVVTTSPFYEGNWTNMSLGQMIIIKRGAIIWNSNLNNKDESSDILNSQKQPQQKQPVPPPEPDSESQPQQSLERILNTKSITRTIDGHPLEYHLYDIKHTTLYEYTSPVEHSTHFFNIQPAEDHVQEIVHSKLLISSKAEEVQYEDVFGNRTIYCVINQPYTKLLVEATSRVKVFATQLDDYRSSQRLTSIPLVWMPWQRQMMTPYLLPSELPESQFKELTKYAMSFVERNNYNLLQTIEDINMSIYRDYEYASGSTSLETTPFEVYTSRKGVCQDFANLLICLARLLSIPARYRMGYIYTGANHLNKIQSEASHAWAELYLPYIGWRGFDPTNGCIVGQEHVRVACGRNYRDAAPTSGTIYRGGGNETLTINVKMEKVY